eukprot:gene12371-3027_t
MNMLIFRTKYSLNAISHDSAIALVKRALEKGVNVKELYVDTVGDAKKYEAKLSEIFPSIQVTVTPKADAKFPIVSAASICAKGEMGLNLSFTAKSVAAFAPSAPPRSYVSDGELCFTRSLLCPCTGIKTGHVSPVANEYPQTKKWLASVLDPVFGYPQFVRFSWSTTSNILESKAFSVEWEDDEEVDESTKNMAPITSFFSQKNKPKEIQRHRFFKERQIEQVADL